MKINALFREYRLIVAQKPDLILAIYAADHKTQVTEAFFSQNIHHIPVLACSYLDHSAQLFIEQDRDDALQESSTQRFWLQFAAIDIDHNAHMPRRSHLP